MEAKRKPHITLYRGYWWKVIFPNGRRFHVWSFRLACQLAAKGPA
jgi:hypothetical protein